MNKMREIESTPCNFICTETLKEHGGCRIVIPDSRLLKLCPKGVYEELIENNKHSVNTICEGC